MIREMDSQMMLFRVAENKDVEDTTFVVRFMSNPFAQT